MHIKKPDGSVDWTGTLCIYLGIVSVLTNLYFTFTN